MFDAHLPNQRPPKNRPAGSSATSTRRPLPLPKRVSPEVFIHPDYVILRTMNNDHALRSEQRDGFLSAKVIEQSGRRQLQLHLRFEGRDHAFGNTGTVDLDLYLPLEELPKLTRLEAPDSVSAKP
ncbi:hypothetical protein [Candidatus Hadarchaeum sp.]|uniref:hypothetical protein n=1 Tax=Candidatus Hadarchaeum sp. TaxID=2883567 RepID=UPI00319E360B